MKLLTTPIGTALYPKLVKPDTKFDEVGSYCHNNLFDKRPSNGGITGEPALHSPCDGSRFL